MKEYKLWSHQSDGIEQLRQAYSEGSQRMCFVAPPGAGKSLVMREVIIPLIRNGKRVNIYLNRRMLTAQTLTYYRGIGIRFGVVAADHPELRDIDAPLQICSIQTVASRQSRWDFEFPWCDFFFVDEKHQQVNEQAESVFRRHVDDGAVEIAFTATPTTLTEETCDRLVTPVDYDELVKIGSHLPVHHYVPSMPDIQRLGATVSESDSVLHNPPAKIIGGVIEHWRRLNPYEHPTILFAPSVAASAWYCEEFIRHGIPSAHIDASRIIVTERDGDKLIPVTMASNAENRQMVMDGSESGRFRCVMNRFVLREAIDMPWLYHGVCTCTFSSLSSYLQASGRVLRYTDLYDHVIWQDHGANIHRWGFINQPRDWEIGKDNRKHFSERKEQGEKASEPGEVEPIVCPKCDACRTHGVDCPECGHVHKMTTRKVRELDGELKLVRGRYFKKAKEKTLETFVVKSLYMHRGLCRKNRACYHNKTVEDVARHAVNTAEREGIDATMDDALAILKRRGKGATKYDNVMESFFPNE